MRDLHDVIIVGGGMLGSAIGYGMAKSGRDVLVLDGADTDFRSAKANFGLVWVQGKGRGCPAYQRLTHLAASLWPNFARTLSVESGICLDFEQRGGLVFCLGEEQLAARAAAMDAWAREAPEQPSCARMLDRGELGRLLPNLELGSEVSGASFGTTDGHVNPLKLLTALQRALLQYGGSLQQDRRVTEISRQPNGEFRLSAGSRTLVAKQLVIAAGLGSAILGQMVGLEVPFRPDRGQLLVTERIAPILPFPCSGLRQTAEGSVMIGLTQEDVGLDISTTTSAASAMSRAAIRVLPELASARIVRHWSCLRLLTPDFAPIYAESQSHPGAWVAVCHSGVTLAALHAGPLVDAMSGRHGFSGLNFFHPRRFNVLQPA